ncbi:MAG: outer membrane protein assembly factor BamC [Candidatus Malihini olakiniferum]
MTSSVQKSMVATVVSLSLFILLAACSSEQRHKSQVSGDESYLKAPQPKVLVSPAGMILPAQNNDYKIQAAALTSELGKALDIRPPLQLLALLSGSRTKISGDTATLLIENSMRANCLWPQIVQIVQDKGYVIDNRQDAIQTLTTDWIFWPREDESVPYQAHYQISVQPQRYQLAIVVKLLGLELQNTQVAEELQVQRYTSMMANSLSDALEKHASAREKCACQPCIGYAGLSERCG